MTLINVMSRHLLIIIKSMCMLFHTHTHELIVVIFFAQQSPSKSLKGVLNANKHITYAQPVKKMIGSKTKTPMMIVMK